MTDTIYQQMSLFGELRETKQITKPIRLIEFFAGIGSQFKALKQLTDHVESWKICEWAFNSYLAYNYIHIKDFKDYSSGKTKEELIEKVRGTSVNYNEPLTDAQLNKKPLEWLKRAYNSIVATNNLVNIMTVKGKDLEIVETDKYEYILTYSFPCQDLSLAGLQKGMATSQKEGGTRSGLLWEVERILTELHNEHREKPQILLMENVPEVCGSNNKEHFVKWCRRLEKLGYQNYFEILNAKDYGIPQNRRRCFMVSILGDYFYEFPHKLHLKYKLKDILEKSVDEKYYLSDKMIQYISAPNDKWTGNNNGAIVNRTVGCTINTAPTQRRCDASNYIADDLPDNTDISKFVAAKYKNFIDKNGKIPEMFNPYNEQEITELAPTQTTNCSSTGSSATVLIAENDGGGNNYIGIYDCENAYSSTFRPTIESRIHLNVETSKTLTTRNDSCCIIVKERKENENKGK